MFDWLGTLSHRAMRRILIKYSSQLGISGIEYGSYHISFKMQNCNKQQFVSRLIGLIDKDGGVDPLSLVSPSEAPCFDKYDPILPPDLMRRAYAVDRLNPEEAVLRLRQQLK